MRDVADRTQSAIERRTAEAVLVDLADSLERQVAERTRERDRSLLNSLDLLAVMDGDGAVLSVNPAWTAILGWLPDELAGRDPVEFSHLNDRGTRARFQQCAGWHVGGGLARLAGRVGRDRMRNSLRCPTAARWRNGVGGR